MVETSSWRCLSVAMILGLLAIVSSVHAVADNGRKATSPASPAASTTSPAVDRESEAVVNRLVQSHLPELTDVLKQLRAVQPREYERAIQDLAKAARKLELAQNRDPRLFDIELELLQAQHRISLLTAKLKVRDSESDRKRLRAAAKRLHDAQVTRARIRRRCDASAIGAIATATGCGIGSFGISERGCQRRSRKIVSDHASKGRPGCRSGRFGRGPACQGACQTKKIPAQRQSSAQVVLFPGACRLSIRPRKPAPSPTPSECA